MNNDTNHPTQFVELNDTSVYSYSFSHGKKFSKSVEIGPESVQMVLLLGGEIDKLESTSENIDDKLINYPLRAWVCATDYEYSIRSTTDLELISMIFPVQVLKEFGIVNYPNFLALSFTQGLLHPASLFLESILHLEMPLPTITSYFIEKLIHEMVGGILLENLGIAKGGTSRRSIYDQAMALIMATAEDPSLNPQCLANSLSVSLRQLQRDFKKNGQSIADTIKRHRCELAIRLLTDRSLDVLPLSKIAEHSGFGSVVQLRRSLGSMGFRYPSEYRKILPN